MSWLCATKALDEHVHIHIHIYKYICVCMCVAANCWWLRQLTNWQGSAVVAAAAGAAAVTRNRYRRLAPNTCTASLPACQQRPLHPLQLGPTNNCFKLRRSFRLVSTSTSTSLPLWPANRQLFLALVPLLLYDFLMLPPPSAPPATICWLIVWAVWLIKAHSHTHARTDVNFFSSRLRFVF